MQKCIDEVKTWMTVNTLKLNDDTTEAMIVSSGRKSSSLSSSFPESVYVRACVRACVRECVRARACACGSLFWWAMCSNLEKQHIKEYAIIVQVSDFVLLVVRDVCRTIYRSFIRRKVTFLLNIWWNHWIVDKWWCFALLCFANT